MAYEVRAKKWRTEVARRLKVEVDDDNDRNQQVDLVTPSGKKITVMSVRATISKYCKRECILLCATNTRGVVPVSIKSKQLRSCFSLVYFQNIFVERLRKRRRRF